MLCCSNVANVLFFYIEEAKAAGQGSLDKQKHQTSVWINRSIFMRIIPEASGPCGISFQFFPFFVYDSTSIMLYCYTCVS